MRPTGVEATPGITTAPVGEQLRSPTGAGQVQREAKALAGWIHPDRFDERMAMKTLDEVNRRFLTVPLDGTYLVDLKKP